MKILHLSHTPLVGAPGRICRALNMHAGVEARWAVLDAEAGAYGKMAFDLDLRWDRDQDEILALAEGCDVLHLHNYLGLDSREFVPLDFRALWEHGKPMVRHFHSTPDLIARFTKQSEQSVLDCPIPKLVIAQYPERFFPNAKLVPNIVFPEASGAAAETPVPSTIRIGYAPSRFNSARVSRWDTKGYPETRKMLRVLERAVRARGARVEIDVIEQVSHHECMTRKARCQVVVDDLATGSYHLNTLESLAQGVACVTFMDRRTQQAVAELIGRNDFPAIVAGLEHAEAVLLDLVLNPQITVEIGRQSRDWMLQYWSPLAMAQHFLDAYDTVLRDPRTPFPARFGSDPAGRWRVVAVHDALWRARMAHWPAITPVWALNIKGTAGAVLRRVGLR